MNVLFIAYFFPPIGGAGSQRSLKFARYLPDHGITPVVVAGSGESKSRWEPADSTLLQEIPSSIPIIRPVDRMHSGPGFRKWWRTQIEDLGGSASLDHSLSAILVTLGPYDGLAAALILGQRLGLPVVADLRDPWALDEVRSYKTAYHRWRELATMESQLSRCSHVIANTDEAAIALIGTLRNLDPNRVSVIPNGFDAADFSRRVAKRNDDRFRVVHTGYLHTELAYANRRFGPIKRILRGSMWQIDLETRSHVHLLRAVEALTVTDPSFAARINIILAGVLSETDKRTIEASPVGHQVVQLGYVRHQEAVDLMRSADALFLPLHNLPAGERSRIVPGKTYEYLASGTPIVAAVPSGDARDLVERLGAGVTTDPADSRGIARALKTISERPDDFRMDLGRLKEFERQTQAGELAAILREVVASQSPEQ